MRGDLAISGIGQGVDLAHLDVQADEIEIEIGTEGVAKMISTVNISRKQSSLALLNSAVEPMCRQLTLVQSNSRNLQCNRTAASAETR